MDEFHVKKISEDRLLRENRNAVRQFMDTIRQQPIWDDDAYDPTERAMARRGGNIKEPHIKHAPELNFHGRGYNRGGNVKEPLIKHAPEFHFHGRGCNRGGNIKEPHVRHAPELNFRGRGYNRGRGGDWHRNMQERPSSRGSSSESNLSNSCSHNQKMGQNRKRRGKGRKNGGNFNYKKVSAQDIVCALFSCDFSSTLLNLMDRYDYDFRSVKQIVKENCNIFSLDDETVTLKCDIKVCEDHLTERCLDITVCEKLHICPKFVRKECEDAECILGHFWKTNHNLVIFKKYAMESVPDKQLSLFFNRGSAKKGSNLEVCSNFNSNNCDKTECEKLHLCFQFLIDGCFSDCKLPHKITKENHHILLLNNISINETPKDIIDSIKSNISVKQQLSSLSLNGDVASDNITSKKVKQKKIKTMWSDDYLGDVVKPEICYASVESICLYEEKGCWRLHSHEHYHWQTREPGKPWCNLPRDFVVKIEKNYCDPNIDSVDLPPLDRSTLSDSMKRLFSTLLRRKWTVDFKNMALKSLENNILELRRLESEKTDNETPLPCSYNWYFYDVNSVWVLYGQSDTGNNYKSKITSDDIENEFRIDPTKVFNFRTDKFNYSLDLGKMIQTNLESNVSRKICRRPQYHIKEETPVQPSSTIFDVPGYWEPIAHDQQHSIVTLSHSSEEFKKISNLVGQQHNILKIKRIQNPFLWRAYQNKKKELEALHKDPGKVNEQNLFHGTHPNVVSKIFIENFDWRLHGSNVGQAYGRGTYFSPNAHTSYSYTSPDANNQRFMFLAKVIVGICTTGNSSMTRPPINPSTNMPFETTVDNILNPNILVKYDKQEYYPDYIITLS